jgi:short-subunit dehydrogenase
MKKIIITGASTGIGAELSLGLAKKGVSLGLFANKSHNELINIAKKCESLGSLVECFFINVEDVTGMSESIKKYIKNSQGLDLVIANAGVAIVEDEQHNAQEAARMNMGVNYFGVINTILPCIDEMKKNQSGQIVIISSISSLRSTHNSGPYSASKAAINMWAEGARLSLKKYSINVSIIRVGFVKTKMTAKNKFKMHGIVSPTEAAKEIIEAIKKKKIDIALPWKSAYIWKVLSIIPDKFYDHIMCKLKNKIDKG